jgi:hypothetical protein
MNRGLDLDGCRQGKVAGCKTDNGTSGCVKCGRYIDYLRNCWLMKDSAPWVLFTVPFTLLDSTVGDTWLSFGRDSLSSAKLPQFQHLDRQSTIVTMVRRNTLTNSSLWSLYLGTVYMSQALQLTAARFILAATSPRLTSCSSRSHSNIAVFVLHRGPQVCAQSQLFGKSLLKH